MINLQIKEPTFRGNAIRNHLNLSLFKLSSLTAIDTALLKEFENGTKMPTALELRELSKALGVSASYLMGTNDVNGVSEFNYRDESLEEFIVNKAEEKGIDLEHFTDPLLQKNNENVRDILYGNYMSFMQLYFFAVALDVSLDYLLGTTPYENWLLWEEKEYPSNSKERKSLETAYTEREYFEKNFKTMIFPLSYKAPFGLLKDTTNQSCSFFSNELGVSLSRTREWVNIPIIHSIDHLIYIAKNFNVNCAYLLGLTHISVPDSSYELQVNLNEQLNDAKVSLGEFKEQCNLNTATIKHINGHDFSVKIKKYLTIANFFDVSIDYLLGLTPFKNWETDYMRAINPVAWITQGTAVNVYDNILEEPIDTLYCIKKTSSKVECVNKQGEIQVLTDTYVHGKKFIKLYPII